MAPKQLISGRMLIWLLSWRLCIQPQRESKMCCKPFWLKLWGLPLSGERPLPCDLAAPLYSWNFWFWEFGGLLSLWCTLSSPRQIEGKLLRLRGLRSCCDWARDTRWFSKVDSELEPGYKYKGGSFRVQLDSLEINPRLGCMYPDIRDRFIAEMGMSEYRWSP